MENGSLLARGETQQIFEDPRTRKVASMTGCKNFSKAERIDNHTLRLTDWGIVLQLKRQVPEGVNCIGYRAHFFEPVWGQRKENCISFRLSGMDDLPFERRYYLKPEECGRQDADLICWFVQDNERKELDAKPQPDYLKLREEAVMLLHE